VLFLLACWLPLTNLIAQTNPEIRRRVLILDFVNQQKSDRVDYLSASIADAYLEPLGKTKKFELLSRSESSRYLAQLNLKAGDTFNEDIAVRLGEAAHADVVVIGNFVAIEPNINIQARAIDIAEKRVAVSRTKVAKLDATIFDTINAIATDMSSEMAAKLPPLAQRVVYQDAGFFTARDFIFHGVLNSGLTWGFENKFLGPGFGLSADTSFKFFHRFVQPYFSGTAIFTGGKTRVEQMSTYNFAGGLTYALMFTKKWWMIQETHLRPIFTGGLAIGTIQARGNINYLVPSLTVGAVADFFVHRRWSITVLVQQQFLFDADTTLKLISIGLGAGYKL